MSKNSKVIIRRPGKQNLGPSGPTGQPYHQAQDLRQPGQGSGSFSHDAEVSIPQNADDLVSSESANTDMNPSAPEKTIQGFELEGANRNQQYFIRAAVILCDCSVQRSPDGIFDVLARNFGDLGLLTWWLRRVGKAHLVDLVKGKDLVDAVRKVAHALHRELSGVIGRPTARW